MLVLLGDLRVWLILIVLTAVETAFGVAKYELGKEGENEIEKHFPDMNQKRWQQAEQWFNRWGDPVLLLTAVPIFNTLLPLIAGMSGIRKTSFVFWSFLGKFVRYWMLLFVLYYGYMGAKHLQAG